MLRITATVVATALLALAPAAWAEDGPLTEFALPTGASNPTAITVGPDGALWFTEASSNKIGRITTAGAISEFPLPTANAQPNGIIAGADGNLWFTETNTSKIGRMTPAGALSEFATPTAASQPMGITLGGDGNVWFTEYGASKVARITPAGVITEFSTLFGSDGPLYITPSPGNMDQVWYSAGVGNHFGFQGLTSGVAGETTLSAPTGSPGGTPGSTPTGIVAGADGAYHAIATAKSGGAGSLIPTLVRLPQLFGTFTDVSSLMSTGSQLAADPSGGFWYVAYSGMLVRELNDGVYTDQVSLTGGVHETCYSASNARACPLNGVVLGPDKAVWFTDHANNAIGRFPSSYVPAPPPVAGPAGP
ncbi:MAG: vgb3, partial [Conexibacter sp.]|nr:vgb3 [Conexibacter sp.]